MTSEVRGSCAPTPWEVSSALAKSLICKSIRNPGLKLRSITIGALASSTVLPASPPRIAWKTRLGSTPALVASTSASDIAGMHHGTGHRLHDFIAFIKYGFLAADHH